MKNVKYNYSGKFTSIDDQWIHLTRILPDYELIFVSEGSVHISNQDIDLILEPGDYAIFEPGKLQSGIDRSFCTMYWLHFEATHNHTFPMHGSLKSLERLIVFMKQLQGAELHYGKTEQLDAFVGVILGEIMMQDNLGDNKNETQRNDLIIREVLEFVRLNISGDIKVRQIAHYFGYNEKYISEMIKVATGSSLKQYITTLRLELACSLLLETNLSVKDIAAKVGYNSDQNFMRQFKKAIDVSPTEYRSATQTFKVID